MSNIQTTARILQDLRARDIKREIFMLRADATPFLLFSEKAMGRGPRIVDNPEFYHFESDIQTFTCNPAVAYANNATTIYVSAADGVNFRAYDVVYNLDKDDYFLVTAVTAGSPNYSLTVTRNYPTLSGNGQAGATTDTLMIVHNLYDEGANKRAGVYMTPVKVTNYTTIIRTPFAVSGTLMSQLLEAGVNGATNYLQDLLNRKLHEHKLEIERTLIWGKAAEMSSTLTGLSEVARDTAGFFSRVVTNVSTISNLTKAQFNNFLRTKAFDKGSDKKLMIAGGLILEALHWFYEDNFRINDEMSKLHYNIREIVTPYGILMVSYAEELFKLNSSLAGTAIIVDPANIRRVVLKGRDTKLIDTTTPGVDGISKEYRTECGLELQGERTHAILKGVTSYS